MLLEGTHFTAESEYGGGVGNLRFSIDTLFPATIASCGSGRYWLELADSNFAVFAARATALYVLLYASAIIFFCFFYHGVGFQPA